MKCINCGFALSETSKFCSECGTTVGKKPCVNCKSSIDKNAKFCDQCGAKQGDNFIQQARGDSSNTSHLSDERVAITKDKRMIIKGDYIYFIGKIYGYEQLFMKVNRTNQLEAVEIYNGYNEYHNIMDLLYYDNKIILYIDANTPTPVYDIATQTITHAPKNALTKGFDNGISADIDNDGNIRTYDWRTGEKSSFKLEQIFTKSLRSDEEDQFRSLTSIRVHNGYGYACVVGYCTSVRFPLSDPSKFEMLPPYVHIEDKNNDYISTYFYNKYLITNKYSVERSHFYVVVIDLDSLKIIREFTDPLFDRIEDIFGNKVKFSTGDYGDGKKYIMDLDVLELKEISKWNNIYGSECVYDEDTYALDDNTIYKVPNSIVRMHDPDFDQEDYVYYKCSDGEPFRARICPRGTDETIYSFENNEKTQVKFAYTVREPYFFRRDYIVLPDGTAIGFMEGHTDENREAKGSYYNLYSYLNGNYTFLGMGSSRNDLNLYIYKDKVYWKDYKSLFCKLDGSEYGDISNEEYQEIVERAKDYTNT